MFFKEIHHVAVNASDYQTTKNFYVEKLGLEVLRENHRPKKNNIKLDLKLGSQELGISISDQFPARLSYPEALGLRHLTFRIEHIEEMIAFLNEQGIETEPLRIDDSTGKKMTFFFDPDGLPLGLHE